MRILIVTCAFVLSACGQQYSDQRNRRSTAPELNDVGTSPYSIVRGQWEVNVNAQMGGFGLLASTRGSATVDVTVNVAERVRFEVQTGDIAAPTDPEEGTESFGFLTVDRLRDNKLKQCGINGDEQCTTGTIRIYTSGKPGSGMWHDDDGYGIPITSDGESIGVDQAGALDLASFAIGNKRVLKLSDFGGDIAIPLEVNFDDAGAGGYSVTLVVEYVLQ
jgi:hypothetical protein